ncbi:MAG: fasciclin domain-containing protein [Myxococcota bacterium]
MVRSTLAAWTLVGLIACAGDDMDSVDSGEPMGEPDIVDVASADAELSTLVDLVAQAGLVETLQGDGPFTVFAPTNDAFSQIDASGLSNEELTEILTYHVVAGRVDSSSIPALADSVATYTLFFDTSNGVQVNDATVERADIEASNGIIHVIDTVLLPPDILTAAGFAGLSELAGAVGAADASVATTLGGDGPFTVFAPTNDAFGAITAPSDPAALADILFYHAIAGAEVDSSSIPAVADSAANLTLFFDTSDGVVVNDANVAIADVRTTNGIVHVIDKVLLPPDILTAAGFAGLNSLAGAIGSADASVVKALSGDGPFTVFAPTDDAFGSITAPTDPTELANVLFYHVYPGSIDAASIPAKADSALQNSFGINVSAVFSTDGGVSINNANVAVADVRTTNGIVHVIDAVLLPPSILDLAGYAGLSSLANALTTAPGDLIATLSAPGPFTVFAPTDAAFTAAPAVTGKDLTNVLLYHVVDPSIAAPVLFGDLMDGEVATALGGTDTITIDVTAGTAEGATIALPDVNGTNGTVHVIDAVMIPPSFN